MGEVIADIAAVFHWPLADLAAMEIEELIYWQARAIARIQRPHCAFVKPA